MLAFMKCVRIAALLLVSFATTGRAPAVSSALSADQASVLESARAYSVEYIRKLPNFICTQITNRERTGFTFGSVITSDVIEEKLTFANQKESCEVVRINLKKVSGVQHMAIPGSDFCWRVRQLLTPYSTSSRIRLSAGTGWLNCAATACMFSLSRYLRGSRHPDVPRRIGAGISLPRTLE